MTIPSTMRAVQLLAYDGRPESIAVKEIPVPRPGPGQVLVKVFASPINPSDLAFIRGMYGFKKPLPAVPGFEGSGVVVESGPGFMSGRLKGRRVTCAAADPGIAGGLWAEYLVTSAALCIPIGKHVEMEKAASLLVNPFTAWALVEIARDGRHKAIVQTAAASALGRMVLRLGKRFSIPVINIVRRSEQFQLLRSLGAEYVVNSSEDGFTDKLRELCGKLGATIGFDAVAGDLSGVVLGAQPRRSRLLVYGALSFAPCVADPTMLIFEEKRIEGFWLSAWLQSQGALNLIQVAGEIQKLLDSDLKTEIHAKVPLKDAARALQDYEANMTAGKTLLMP